MAVSCGDAHAFDASGILRDKARVLAAQPRRGWGVVGSKDILEGRKYGLFRTYVRTEDPDWSALVDDLGIKFPLLDQHGFKVWPACGYTRATNAATQQLRRKHDLNPDDIETITVIGGSGGTQLLSEPIELKRRPRLSIDGKYSIPFTTAVMMVKGNVTLHDYTDDGLRDPEVLAMADRVFYRARVASDGPETELAGLPLPTVEIETKDGRTLLCTPDGVPGDPRHPLDWSLVETKFQGIALHSPSNQSRQRISNKQSNWCATSSTFRTSRRSHDFSFRAAAAPRLRSTSGANSFLKRNAWSLIDHRGCCAVCLAQKHNLGILFGTGRRPASEDTIILLTGASESLE